MKRLSTIIVLLLCIVVAAASVHAVTQGTIIVSAYTDPTNEDIAAQNPIYNVVEEENVAAENEAQVSEIDQEEISDVAFQVSCDHEFTAYVISEAPNTNAHGTQTRECIKCGTVEETIYVCPHAESCWVETIYPTCEQEGIEIYECIFCKTVTTETVIEKIPCNFSDWRYTSYATPVSNGTMSRYCETCGASESKPYEFTMPSANSIYVPETHFYHSMHVGNFTQSEVDRYDLVYSTNATNSGAQDPFLIGHNYGTMRYLDEIKVGQYIYLSINDNIEIFEVVISEYALQNDEHTNITGQTSGFSIFDSVGEQTLHMYTCYGGGEGRWMVLAKRIA